MRLILSPQDTSALNCLYDACVAWNAAQRPSSLCHPFRGEELQHWVKILLDQLILWLQLRCTGVQTIMKIDELSQKWRSYKQNMWRTKRLSVNTYGEGRFSTIRHNFPCEKNTIVDHFWLFVDQKLLPVYQTTESSSSSCWIIYYFFPFCPGLKMRLSQFPYIIERPFFCVRRSESESGGGLSGLWCKGEIHEPLALGENGNIRFQLDGTEWNFNVSTRQAASEWATVLNVRLRDGKRANRLT